MKKLRYKFDRERPMSWSCLSCFEYDKEQWWEKYCKHGKCAREMCAIESRFTKLCPVIRTTPEMEFGSMVGKKLETDPTFLPCIPREGVMEHEFKAEFAGIPLIGFADSFGEPVKRLREYKTGVKSWTQKRVDDHGQITMYLFMQWLKNKTRPEEYEVWLHWMPTVKTENALLKITIAFKDPIEEHVQHFKTRRTMHDLMMFAKRLKNARKEMEAYEKLHMTTI